MTPLPTHPRPRPDPAWPGLCAVLALGVAAAWFSGNRQLAWQASTWTHQPWLLWTASLAHLSGAHLLGNLLGLAVLAVLGSYLNAGTAAALAVLLAWPLATLALVWWPQVTAYSGMSGLLNAMAAVLWAHAALRGGAKPVSFMIFALLGLKLASEHAWSQPIAFDPNWGFNVVYAAHLSGALAGAACGLVFSAIAAARTRSG